MNERAVVFGKKDHLVGITTEPGRYSPASNKPAVILLNAGLVHRVGPNRVYVQIARRLAASGFIVLRFDLAGIGDSGNRTDNLSLRDGILSDVKDAMNYLAAKHHCERFILSGICSGADNSLRVARSDNRVIGAIPIEAYTFSNPRYHLYFYRKRIFELRRWRRLLTMQSQFWRILRERMKPSGAPRVVNSSRSPTSQRDGTSFKKEVAAEIQDLLKRGLRFHFIYLVDSSSYYNHYLTLKKKFSMWKQCSVTLFTETDHIFTSLASQEALVEVIHYWVNSIGESPSVTQNK